MTTRLQGPLKREIQIAEDTYTLTISPEGLLLARKGHRKGTQLRWVDLLSSDAAHPPPEGASGGEEKDEGR